jgi:class 3 adenylate cyclase
VTEVLSGPEERLEAARAAFERHEWQRAYDLLLEADVDGGLSSEGLELLGEAAWWTARLDEAIRFRERAYAAYLRESNRPQAAGMALWLVMDYAGKRKLKLAMGALRRAQKLLADEPEGPVHGAMAGIEAMFAFQQGDLDAAAALAERAQEIGVRFDASDIEAFGQMVLGTTRVAAGDVEDGFALLDEATSAAVAGELSPKQTGIVYCATIAACAALADFDRAGEWTEATEMWCEQEGIEGGFPGICRVHRAQVKRFQGHWAEAEQEASRAAAELMNFMEDIVGLAYYEVGEVRLRRGDFDGAEEAFGKAHEFMRDPEPGMSLLRLVRGEVVQASTSIRRALGNPSAKPLDRVRLLPAQVDIALAAGDLEVAQKAVAELEALAEQYRSPSSAIRAATAHARGVVLLAEGKPDEAAACLRRALVDWQAVHAPYEAARTRVDLARAYEELGDLSAAQLELESARSAFERLGAHPDARLAAERLAELTKPETVTRTFVFTDIVRSTEFVRRIGDEAWAGLLRTHDRTLRAGFAAHGGEEVDHAGDGFFVAFVDPEAALRCAVTVQQTIADPARFGELQVRVGVHTATVARLGGSYRGQGVHAAARIAALAAGGEIVASAATLDAAAGDFPVEERRAVTLRGIDEPVEVATVSWR